MKRKIAKCLLNFLVLNLFGLAPLLVAINFGSPDLFRIECSSGEPFQLLAASGRGQGGTLDFNRAANVEAEDGNIVACVSYPDGIGSGEYAYKLIGDRLNLKVQKVSLLKHTFIRLNISPAEFFARCSFEGECDVNVDDSGCCSFRADEAFTFITQGSDSFNGCSWGLTLDGIERKWHRRIIYLEFLLILVAFAFTFYSDCASAKKLAADSLFVAAGYSVFIGFLLPLQIYLSNRSTYTFPLLELLPDGVVAGVVVLVTVFLCLWALGLRFGRWPHLIATAFLVYEYFLTGPLLNGAPALNGGIAFFGTPELIGRDFLVLGSIMGVFIAGYHWIKDYLAWCIAAFAVMSGATVADAAMKPQHAGAETSTQRHGAAEIASCIRHSPKRNVIVICLDSVRGDIIAKLLREDDKLAALFPGFTLFANNVGMYPVTIYGMSGFMLGRYALEGEKPEAYMDKITGEESFIAPYLKDGVATWFLMGAPKHMFTNQLSNEAGQIRVERGSFHWRPDTIPPLSIVDTMRFKLTPFWYKGTMLSRTAMSASDSKTFKRESVLFPYIENAPIDEQLEATLQCYHTYGTHSPVNIDRDGNYINIVGNVDSALEDMSYYIIRRTGELLESFRSKGIYDNSFIVILADHGNIDSNHPVFGGKDILGYAVPLLMVKPIGNEAGLKISEVPTSHVRIHDMMIGAHHDELGENEIIETLKSGKRLFINQESYYTLSSKQFIDEVGNVVEQERK